MKQKIIFSILFILITVSLFAQKYIKLDFNETDVTTPLYKYWATSPCYIERKDNCMEFYYNQAALDNENVRKRRGAELRWDYKSYDEGWYGFRFFLPEGKFPKNAKATHIAQIFQFGACNSWAGLLSIEGQDLMINHRHHCGNPTIGLVKANIPWNTWIEVVMHFKASKNGTGKIQVWIDNDSKESPSYNKQNINFGFGEWDNDITLAEGNDLGGKWGMYCSEDGDRTIRFDDLAILSGKDERGFEKVKPGSTFPVIMNPTKFDCSVGNEFIMHITATNNPTGYNATGLPQWLTIDRSTGIISGTPEETGTYVFTIYATTDGGTNSQSIILKVGGDLVAYYPFDNYSTDHSGYGRRPSTYGTVSYSEGKYEQAISLNGTNTYINAPEGILNSLNDITIMAWVYDTEVRSNSRIFDFGTGTDAYMFLTPKSGATGYPRFAIKNGGSEYLINSMTQTLFPKNEWTHIAVTLDNNYGRMYINGVQVGSNTNLSVKPSDLISSANNYLGRSQFSSDPYFKGLIDEFRIYRKALSAKEINNIANNINTNIEISKLSPAILYPNPVTDYMNIELHGDDQKQITLSVKNLCGITVLNQKITEQKNTIDLSDLFPGLYILTLANQNNILTSKKIVKK